MSLAPVEFDLELIPHARVDVIDVRRLVSRRFGDALDSYPKALCCSLHTTAGYLDQGLPTCFPSSLLADPNPPEDNEGTAGGSCMGSAISGRSLKKSGLATGLIALSILATGFPAAAEPGREIQAVPDRAVSVTNGNDYHGGGDGTGIPCGTVREGGTGGAGEEPRVSDPACSIETLRKRAAKARISMPALPGRAGS